eukprot:COSAG05_NODE_8023_length_744_cov_1.993798_1_plen_39_part_01
MRIGGTYRSSRGPPRHTIGFPRWHPSYLTREDIFIALKP